MADKTSVFLKKARNMAEKSSFYRQRMGCVVTYKGRIISSGFNSNKTHPIQNKYNRIRFEETGSPDSLHAEIHALSQIQNLDIDWNKVTVYTYRIMKSREFGLAKPCKSCMAYIKSLGIKHICYTTNDGFAHEYLIN